MLNVEALGLAGTSSGAQRSGPAPVILHDEVNSPERKDRDVCDACEESRASGPIIGQWRSSGTVLDDEGHVTAEVSGTDGYDLLPGGHWIAHEVDVHMGDQRTLVHELIGGVHPACGWQMHAFDEADTPGVMRLSQEEPDLLLLHGDGVRSWFRIRAGEDRMITLWEREVEGSWLPWMDVRFERL